MPAVPLLRPRDGVRLFERLGWPVARQRGSHIIMIKPGGIATLSIPEHGLVARGILPGLIGRAGLTVEDFLPLAE